jgi:Cu(I)/Ag(I) efflux system membrane protein CusA/SilA
MLEEQSGRLFKPLAFTKTYSMAAAAILSITLAPVLMSLFIRGRIPPEEKNPINRFLIWLYHPTIRLRDQMETVGDLRCSGPGYLGFFSLE